MTRSEDRDEASNSEVQSFMDCRRRWWLSYYRQLRPRLEAPVGPMAVGNRVHKALEEGYSTPGREEAARAVLAATIAQDRPRAEAAGVLKEFESQAELCVIMLEGFFDWAAEEGLDSGWEVVEHERVVETPPIELGGGLRPVVFKGKLDQLVRRELDEALFMRDWKTVDVTPEGVVMISYRPQLKSYLLILALTEPQARVSGGQFVFLRRVKRTARATPPFYWVDPQRVGPRELESFFLSLAATLRRMSEAADALDAGADHREVCPPRPTRDCKWRCPFYSCCEMFDDGSNVEAYLEVNYRRGDPYEYYGLETGDRELAGG